MKKFLAFMLVALLVIPAAFAFSASAEATNVALNKTVAITGSGVGYEDLEGQYPASYRAPLTDGVAETELTYGTTNNWFGFYYNATASATLVNAPDGVGAATIDLGAATDGLVSARAHVVTPEASGIGTPKSITVAVSADGESFTDVGTLQGLAKSNEGYWADLTFDKAYNAQYVRFTFELNLDGGVFAFLNELEVYADPSQQGTDPEPSEPTTVPEEITVDGDLSDNGWAEDGWVEASVENGNGSIQGQPTEATGADKPDRPFKFQYRTDEENIYIAVVMDTAFTPGNPDGRSGTNFRIWFHVDNEYAQYTHFYDVWGDADGNSYTAAKYNQSKESNSGAAIENSGVKGFIKEVDGKTVVEMSVPIAEFVPEGMVKVPFYANTMDIFKNGNDADENVGMFYPVIPYGPEDAEKRFDVNLPWVAWYADGEGIIDLEAAALGEITVEPDPSGDTSEDEGDDYEEQIKANMGDENQDAKFEVTLTGPESIEAGKEFEVVATVNKVAQGAELAQISFNLGFDSEVLELLNEPNNENVVELDATVPNAWENLTRLGESEGLLEVNFTNANDATSIITEDGAIVITFKFKAKEGTEKAGLWIDHESVASNDSNFVDFTGNGTYLILNAAGETSTDDSSAESAASSAVQTGDGSVNVIVLAIIALVAVAGCAVVIKTRR